jgi:hypothetical protein
VETAAVEAPAKVQAGALPAVPRADHHPPGEAGGGDGLVQCFGRTGQLIGQVGAIRQQGLIFPGA